MNIDEAVDFLDSNYGCEGDGWFWEAERSVELTITRFYIRRNQLWAKPITLVMLNKEIISSEIYKKTICNAADILYAHMLRMGKSDKITAEPVQDMQDKIKAIVHFKETSPADFEKVMKTQFPQCSSRDIKQMSAMVINGIYTYLKQLNRI